MIWPKNDAKEKKKESAGFVSLNLSSSLDQRRNVITKSIFHFFWWDPVPLKIPRFLTKLKIEFGQKKLHLWLTKRNISPSTAEYFILVQSDTFYLHFCIHYFVSDRQISIGWSLRTQSDWLFAKSMYSHSEYIFTIFFQRIMILKPSCHDWSRKQKRLGHWLSTVFAWHLPQLSDCGF